MLRKSYDADLGRFRAAFLQSRDPVFLAHITASDAFLHVRTAQQARPLLLEFDDLLRELYFNARGDLGIIAFSDHGNTQVPNRAVPLKTFLAAHGWRVKDSLDSSRDVAIPAYGLVGFAAIYCRQESVAETRRRFTRNRGRRFDRKPQTQLQKGYDPGSRFKQDHTVGMVPGRPPCEARSDRRCIACATPLCLFPFHR